MGQELEGTNPIGGNSYQHWLRAESIWASYGVCKSTRKNNWDILYAFYIKNGEACITMYISFSLSEGCFQSKIEYIGQT